MSGSYVDHSEDEKNNSRSITENFGRFVGPYLNSTGELCAKEYHFNVQSSFAKDFAWMLKNIPNRIGFSIVADARGRVSPNGSRIVDRIDKVNSFDLVDGPATTKGIFNLQESVKLTKQAFSILSIREQIKMSVFDSTVKTVATELATAIEFGSMDRVGVIQGVKRLLTLLGEPTDVEFHLEEQFKNVSDADKEAKAMELASKSGLSFVKVLVNSLDNYKVREQEQKKADNRKKLEDERVKQAKTKLSDEQITMVFREQLVNAKDDAAVLALIDDRASFVVRERTDTPVSHGQTGDGKPPEEQLKQVTKKYFS
jgi:hypothetical protein